MSFLLDTNICSAHLSRPSGLAHRFIQHLGHLHLPSVALGELYAWAYCRANQSKLVRAIEDDLLADVAILDFDRDAAHEFGRLRGVLQAKGITVSSVDLQIASVALVHNLTLVTHNTKDFQHIPGLRLDDWLVP